jgi:multiple sugar transport system permease protein
MAESRARRNLFGRCLVYGSVAFMFILAIFPFYWMLITSLKTNQEIYSVEANPFYTLEPTLTHYGFLFRETLFRRWLWNTMLVAFASTGISVIASIPAAYALARLRFPAANALGWLIFLFYLVPPTLLFIPLVDVVHRLGLANTLWALILVYPTFLIPFGTWLLTGYFRALPRELEECALVDGCTKVGAMVRIAVPLALPGLLSVFIFAFTLSWNEFIYAMTLVNDVDLRTVPVGAVVEMIRGDGFWWGSLMGAALLASVPVAVLYSFFVDYFVAGLTAGAVKG